MAITTCKSLLDIYTNNSETDAIFFENEKISFNDLNSLVSKIVFKLKSFDIKENDYIIISLPRSINFMAAILAALKIGVYYIPLEASKQTDRLDFIKQDCKAKLVVDEDFLKDLTEEDTSNPSTAGGCVVYTSGSTGKPKGVQMPKKSIEQTLETMAMAFNLDETSKFLYPLPFSFIAHLFFTIATLASGGTVLILDSENRKDISKIQDYILKNSITYVMMPPQLFKRFTLTKSALKAVFVGSEKVVNLESTDDYKLYNLYGSSESFAVSYFEIDKKYANTPIGKPFACKEILLLDENNNIVENEGEVAVAGAIAEKYINKEQETKEKFININGKTFFKTNDIAKKDENGNLIYLNRNDWMVKICGQRVEPGEIENTVKHFSSEIQETVVKSFVNEYGQNYLCCYIKSTNKINISDLKSYLATKLPSYMIPAFFIPVEDFELNQNGKLNKLALLPPSLKQYQAKYVAPTNELEKEITNGFEQVLKLEKVGINDDFFMLGGDSIKTLILLEKCKLNLSAADIMRAKTPKKIAEIANKNLENEDITHFPEQTEYELTASEMGIYLEWSQTKDKTIYNIPNLLSFPKTLVTAEELKNAIENFVNTHNALKSNFVDKNGSIKKIRNDEKAVNISVNKVSENEFLNLKNSFVRPFDLEKDDLFRFESIETEAKIHLLTDIHHIVTDGTSISVMLNDFKNAILGNKIAAEEVTAYDLSLYENELKTSDKYKNAKEFFEQKFLDKELTLTLPTDVYKDELISQNVEYNYILDEEISSNSLSAFLNINGLTENTLFMGAFAYCISKYLNEDEITFRTVNNGRFSQKLKNTVGMLVKTLPLAYKIDETIKTTDFLANVQEDFYKTIDNMSYSYVDFVNEIGINPDIMFVYQAEMLNGMELKDEFIELKELYNKDLISNFALMMFKTEGRYKINLKYNNNLYSKAYIENFLNFFNQIIKEFLKKDCLKNFELVTEKDTQFLKSFNNKRVGIGENKTIIDLFKEQALKTPDNVALVYKDNKYTYKQLNAITDILAKNIISMGIKRGEYVGIYINRCEFMQICAIGVLKSGAAYQPLDSKNPPDRLNFMVQNSEAKLLITSRELENTIEFSGQKLFIEDILSLKDIDIELPKVTTSDKFVLLYTSGSTGMPKGVELTHKNLISYISATIDLINANENTTCLAYASYGFDAHMADFYAILDSGGTVFVASDEMKLNLIELHKYLLENKINLLFTPTQFMKQYVSMFSDNPYLKYFFAGGEKMPKFDMPNYPVYNVYGPTECTISSSFFKIEKNLKFIPIGKTFGNNTTYIVDKYDRLLPVGAAGEIYIAGDQVGLGYLKREDVNLEKFIKNHYDNEFEKIYKTGDIARYLPDGNIDIVGRKDFQVKIRGFRIELTEIENKILEYKKIKDATVVALDSVSGGKYVAAYITADEKIDISDLNNFIKKTLPAYMVPEVTMQIDEIPHNVNGKVDKRKLPKPVKAEKKKTEVKFELNFLETILTDILAQAVGHNDFDITTNFVEAGMTSITAMKFSALVYKKFNYEIKSKVLLDECNIFKVENLLQEYMLSEKAEIQAVKAVDDTKNSDYELTQNQMGVYYETLKNPTTTMYNVPLELTFEKSLDAQKIKTSFEKVLNNHKFVNTYLKQDGERVLLVKNNVNSIVDYKEMTENEYQTFRIEYSTPFDLFKFPLYKACVVKTEANIYLVFDIHHVLFDGMSEGIFLKELIDTYSEKAVYKEEMTYFDFAKQEKQMQNSTEYKNAENFFNKLLENFESSTELKSDITEKADSKLIEYIKIVDTNKVKDFCKTNNLTAAQLFLSASSYALARFTNTKDVYISTISNGRSNPKLQNTFGMFVKTLPLNIKIENNTKVLDFIEDTGKMFRNVIDNELYPYTKISENFGFTPKIVYACQLGLMENNTLEGTEIKVGGLGLEAPKFPLSVHIEENKNQEIVINLQYDKAIYSENLIAKLANAINTTLLNMIDNSTSNIENISMVDKEEQNRLNGFRYSAKEDLEIKLFHKLFEHSVDIAPQKTALIAADGEFTYTELDKAANRVANYLISKGIEIEDKIAILLPRTSNIFKSIFGVLKSGATYIPCDIDYPIERIEQILEDSGAKYIITEDIRVSLYKNALNINDLLACKDESRPNIDVQPNNLAYMIYTSGSTGKPKGVMIEHKGICNYVNPHKENRHVNAFVNDAEIMLSITTISFDMALKEVATALCNAKTLVFANDEETKSVIELAKLFEKTHADAFNATPSRILTLLDWEDFAKQLSNCKVIMCGAENYPMNLYKKLKTLTNARLFNTYGPTEITVSSNCLELTDDIKQVTIGRPLFNYEEFIVDVDGNELPTGVVGELYIGGFGVARGYQNLEEQTKDKFINFKGQRVYKSGDFAKWADNGEVAILGRMDNQVKLRGLRIELDEVQKAIYDFKNVKNAVVVVKKINNVENLCAYFEADTKIDLDELKAEMKTKLPAYMIPSAFMQLENLPVTRNGKVDKKNLPDIVVAKKAQIADSTNKTEKDFCDIFTKVLDLESVSIEDNFFEIGGSSLLATRVIIEAKRLDYNITYGDVFAAKTPKNLAKLFNTDFKDDKKSEFANYDYTQINEILKQNTIENFVNNPQQELGNVLITGATGFLGIHMLVEFIKNETGKAYCLMRKGEFDKPEDRLKTLLFYYFDNDFEELFKNRVKVINGDITNPKIFEDLSVYEINTVINCAANVKHFSDRNDIEEVNYNGVLNIIDYCNKNNLRMIQVSTMSIGGFSIDNKPPASTKLEEQMLYFDQELDGKYVMSKFKAERAVLDAITKGLNAKIMRVGNLSARDTDGEFQINYKTNSFVGRLKAFKLIKKYPYSMINANAEFSPIDSVARAILLLSKSPKECCVFHPFNNHGIFMGDIIGTMQERGMKVEFAENKDFDIAIKKAQENEANSNTLSSLLAYQNMGHGKTVIPIGKANDLTVQALFRMGFKWPIPSREYMNRFFNALEGLGFFED